MSTGRPKVWINGRLAERIDALDRGLQYGDGIFETMRLCDSRIRLLEFHLQRLRAGLARLNIQLPANIRTELSQVAARHADGVLKLIVTRGVGPRGYRPDRAARPTRVLSFEHMPVQGQSAALPARVRVCSIKLGQNPALAGLKTLNRLESVLARSEWSHAGIWEGLMRDEDDNFVSGTMSNLFVRRRSVLLTPSLHSCGVAGVMRRWVIKTAPTLKLRVVVGRVRWADIGSAEEVFMSNAIVGVKSVRSCEWRQQRRSAHFQNFTVAEQLRLRLCRL
jgi:4-amino-4-deoxychorismate lyase